MANGKSKVKDLLSKGYAKAKGTVTPKWVISQIAKKSPLGRVWKRIPDKQKQQITKLIVRGYEAAKGATKKSNTLSQILSRALKKKVVTPEYIKKELKLRKQYGGSIRKAKY